MADPAGLSGAGWTQLAALVDADQSADVRAAGLAWLWVADAVEAQLSVLESARRDLTPRWPSRAGREYLARLGDTVDALRDTAAVARHNYRVMDAAADDLHRAQQEFAAVSAAPLADHERERAGRAIVIALNGRYEQAMAEFRPVPLPDTPDAVIGHADPGARKEVSSGGAPVAGIAHAPWPRGVDVQAGAGARAARPSPGAPLPVAVAPVDKRPPRDVAGPVLGGSPVSAPVPGQAPVSGPLPPDAVAPPGVQVAPPGVQAAPPGVHAAPPGGARGAPIPPPRVAPEPRADPVIVPGGAATRPPVQPPVAGPPTLPAAGPSTGPRAAAPQARPPSTAARSEPPGVTTQQYVDQHGNRITVRRRPPARDR